MLQDITMIDRHFIKEKPDGNRNVSCGLILISCLSLYAYTLCRKAYNGPNVLYSYINKSDEELVSITPNGATFYVYLAGW